jgi:hypothetical protein
MMSLMTSDFSNTKSHYFARRRIAAVTAVLALASIGLAAPAVAGTPAGPVSAHPATGTPALPDAGPAEQIRQLVECGGIMYAVGSFTTIVQDGVQITRHNAFSFSATAPFTVTSWAPDVNGEVNSVAVSGTSCADAYLGGDFSSVNGTRAENIVEVNASTGAVVAAFDRSAAGQVDTLLATGGHLLAGGSFTSVNGSGEEYFASLNLTTGKDDGFVQLGISGNYGDGVTKVYNQQLSHGGTLDLVEGTFTSVGGQPRQQIFMLSLSGAAATVTPWTSPEFSQPCARDEAFYVRAASWSPDDSTIYIATTGDQRLGGVNAGLCDAAAAFPAAQASVIHRWVDYTGCDSLYSTAADQNTAYFGGHERWIDNPHGCNSRGPGAIGAQGMVGLSPANGTTVVLNPTRSRGFGADDMVITSAGLWIASDNAFGANACGHVHNLAGICFLPYN